MKSPTSSVGTIELDGILNGSTRKERSRNTIRITGKKLIEYSTHQGCLASRPLLLRSQYLSNSHTAPVTISRISRKRAKFITAGPSSTIAPLQHGEECLLRNLHRPHLLHALIAFFLLVEQLALARNVAAVALGDHVLAQRFDVLARDDVPADRCLHRHIKHLSWDETS